MKKKSNKFGLKMDIWGSGQYPHAFLHLVNTL